MNSLVLGREKGEGGRVSLACFFGLRLEKTLFVSAASSLADGFTLPPSPFPLPSFPFSLPREIHG